MNSSMPDRRAPSDKWRNFHGNLEVLCYHVGLEHVTGSQSELVNPSFQTHV